MESCGACARVEQVPNAAGCIDNAALSIVTNENRRWCMEIRCMYALIYEGFPHEGFQSMRKIHVFMRDSLIHGGRRKVGVGVSTQASYIIYM